MIVMQEVSSLVFTIYLDSNSTTLSETYSNIAPGVRISVQAPGAVADLELGMTATPGTLTSLKFSATNRTRLPAPHGVCISNEDTEMRNNAGLCPQICDQNLVGSVAGRPCFALARS
jgi:hypothetical protein